MDAEEAARRWVTVWSEAWTKHDVDAILALYAEDCIVRTAPFRTEHLGRSGLSSYLHSVFSQETGDADARFAEPVASGDRAAVEWWAMLQDQRGRPVTLAGCTALRFGPDGLVREARDYWHLEEQGHRQPPEDWGPTVS